MALVETGPLVDERLPTFANGQFFGRLPGTRIVVNRPNVNPAFGCLTRGILLGIAVQEFSDPNNGYAEWRGSFTDDLGDWVAKWRWVSVSPENGAVNFECEIANAAEGYYWIGHRQLFSPLLSVHLTASRDSMNPASPNIPVVSKDHIPEWADVYVRWPDVIVSDTF